MRSPLNIDDFENFLEQEVNQHRMYPSDAVWRNIQQELHGYKKWPALTVISVFVISALVAGTLLIKPGSQSAANQHNIAAKASTEVADKNNTPSENLQQHLSPEHITQQTIAEVSGDVDIDGAIPSAFALYRGVADMPLPENIADNNSVAGGSEVTGGFAGRPIAESGPLYSKQGNGAGITAAAISKNVGNNIWERNKPGFNWMMVAPFDTHSPDMFYLKKGVWNTVYGSIFYLSAEGLPSSAEPFGINIGARSLSKSYGLASLKSSPKSGRFDVQVYVTPSVSYRILTTGGAKAATYLSGMPYSSGYIAGLNQPLRNKPSTGYEGGVSLGYKLSPVFTLRAGVQFNEREYDVEGYGPAGTYGGNGPAPSGAGLNNNGNGMNTGVDVSSQTAAPSKLAQTNVFINRYYQIALPVGIDWKAWGKGKFSFGVAAAVQPTYIFNRQPFIVTTDNNSFADGSKLMRNLNLNANAESYFAYTSGKFKFQIGPQLRYQVLSTLSSSYPVKEHLVDYGVKIAVTRSLP